MTVGHLGMKDWVTSMGGAIPSSTGWKGSFKEGDGGSAAGGGRDVPHGLGAVGALITFREALARIVGYD